MKPTYAPMYKPDLKANRDSIHIRGDYVEESSHVDGRWMIHVNGSHTYSNQSYSACNKWVIDIQLNEYIDLFETTK